ncbi:MAG: DUF5702 domain-containing protein [Clostridiales bacterium]|nr:DUF5702 domain-containing protein [Clostridiales bacterium]MDY4060028.1 DUF5702 domain-containing protein [Anaerovoracaceae bacterium]
MICLKTSIPKFFRRKNGSLSIYLAIFFVLIISVAVLFIQNAKNEAVISSAKSLGSVWLQSELGKYDRHLYKNYGIYGFYGDCEEIKRDVDYMAKYSFKGKKYIKYGGCKVDLGNLNVENSAVFKEQIVRAAGSEQFKKIIERKKPEDIEDNFYFESRDKIQGVINNNAVIADLPSYGNNKTITISGLISKLKDVDSIGSIFKKAGEAYMVDKYVHGFFKNYRDNKGIGQTLFSNEEEYIIAGKFHDESNRKKVKHYIMGIRQAMNTMTIVTNPDMMEEITSAAAALTPGPEAVITEALLIEAWALAESENDYQLLIRGRKVPLRKDRAEWAVDIDSVAHGIKEGYVDMDNKVGESYENYLSLFMYIMDEDTKLLRMMDLIQINMRLNYYEDFLLREYYVGLSLMLNVNNRSVVIEKSYY